MTSETLIYLVHETRTVLQPAYYELAALPEIREAVIARAALLRMLLLTPVSLTDFIQEARNVLVLARYHLYKIDKYREAEFARAAIQHVLDTVTEHAKSE